MEVAAVENGADTGEKDEEKIDLNLTSNAWINNGLIALSQDLGEWSEDKVSVKFNGDSITISGQKDELYGLISQSLRTLSAKGTYNFSTSFKIINKEAGATYSPPKDYPNKKGDLEKTFDILEKERELLKKRNIPNKKKQKIWKMRMSYFGSEENYLKIGLNLGDTDDFKKFKENKNKKFKYICPLCGMPTSTLIEMKQFFNPLSSEHHNNVVEGFSTDIRKKVKACPKCIILSYFSLFDYYIPFYTTGNKTYLAIPNTTNSETLKIIHNNLSLKGQYIDFSVPSCTSYGSNIKSLPHKSKSGAMLALLHNIKNRYLEETPQQLIVSPFAEVTKEEFTEMTEWLFISKNSYSIIHIRANEKNYEILNSFKDPENNTDVYLVPDVLCKISFDVFDENEMEKFYDGLLKLDAKKISNGLFRIAKESVSKSDKIRIGYRAQGSSPLQLFEEVFLDKIMEVSTMLEEHVRKACKDVAKSIGRGFGKDVGMMTKFAYAATPEDFRNAIADASFRLAKISALDSEKNYWIDEKSLEIVLNSLDSTKYEDIKNYFVSFMSVSALSKNYIDKKNEGGK